MFRGSLDKPMKDFVKKGKALLTLFVFLDGIVVSSMSTRFVLQINEKLSFRRFLTYVQ